MDVVNPEQAKIAEEAGAIAVMALERVPADIRKDGGVARMSDPKMIKEIMEAVTIPVFAKVRIGHFVEAQILESIGVDMIDESEVLTAADDEYHIDKRAAMIRTKGEAGTGNVMNAVYHARTINKEIKLLNGMDEDELVAYSKKERVPLDLVRSTAKLGRLTVVNFAAGGLATPADCAMLMQLGMDGCFVGSGIFKSSNPTVRAKAMVKAVTHYNDAKKLAEISENLGTPMVGINCNEIYEKWEKKESNPGNDVMDVTDDTIDGPSLKNIMS